MADQTVLPPARPQRPMMIKGLTPSLPERGKIKIGMKGAMMTSRAGNEFQPPKKLDHFVITTMERDDTGNFKRDVAAHKEYGEEPTDIPIRLLYDDPTLNFPTRYAAYQGRKLWCSGDGETAQRLTPNNQGYEPVSCPCGRQDPTYEGKDKCKMNGALSALLENAGGIGGVWKFRTTSYNSIVGLLSSMAYLKALTGGPLANIPLNLTMRPKQAADPKSGAAVLVYVVGLEYAGSVTDLQKTGHQIALDRAKTHMSIEHIEDEARRILMLSPPTHTALPGDDNDDVVEEYYPEQVAEQRPAADMTQRHTIASANAPPATAAAPLEPAPEPVAEMVNPYPLVDESGVEEARFATPDQWAKELKVAAAPIDGKLQAKAQGYLRNNLEAYQTLKDEITDDAVVTYLDKLYAAIAGAKKAPPPAAKEEPAAASAIEMPMKSGKPDGGAYSALFMTALGALTEKAQITEMLAREADNLGKILPGARRALRSNACVERWVALGGKQEEFPAA